MFKVGDIVRIGGDCFYDIIIGHVGVVAAIRQNGEATIYFEDLPENFEVCSYGTQLHNHGIENPISSRYLHVRQKWLEEVEHNFWEV